MFDNITIILVNTSHPGNIGSSARAMKTMGLTKLALVAPKIVDQKAIEMAAGATDILDNATNFATFAEAIADKTLVIGTSARTRALPWPMLSPRTLAELIKSHTKEQIAIVFGNERTGLTNEQLQSCHYHVMIPANPEYSSLNLAAAVQIIAYEIRVVLLGADIATEWDAALANSNDVQQFFVHLENTLTKLDFLKQSAPRKLMPRLKRLFLRAKLDVMETNILRGILNAIDGREKNA